MTKLTAHVAGHFGEFLQGRLGPTGPVALVTVPCAALEAVAGRGVANGGALPPDVRARFVTSLSVTDDPAIGVSAQMPLGAGAGASTAALVALGRALGAEDAALPAACFAAEGAVDPLMLANPAKALWSSREALVIEALPPPPPMVIVGGFFGPPERTEAADDRFPDISDLIAPWRAACAGGNLSAVARLASISAQRTTAMRGPDGDPTEALASRLGALGWIRAHTGSARGLIFAPATVPANAEAILRDAGMAFVLTFSTP